ncbi:unnamed protein product [Parnassius apollo]|uniref:(apollo) hypothetical protein n=1 Tax=Parnassius apollo TaxID=110799 RepID=A0A8S3WNY5_PARAO|nr:unnamed protein product [Parnassius apollo]
MSEKFSSRLLKPTPELLQLSSKQLAKKKICIRHFEHQYLDGFTRKYHGYPTLLTEEELACGVPSQSITDYYDHTYCKRRQGMEEAAPEIIKKPKYSKEYMLVNLDDSQNSKRENTGETSVSDDITMLSKPSTSQQSYYISMSPKPSTSQQSYDVPISPKPKFLIIDKQVHSSSDNEQPVPDSNDNRNLSCSSEVNLSGNMVSSIFEEKNKCKCEELHFRIYYKKTVSK